MEDSDDKLARAADPTVDEHKKPRPRRPIAALGVALAAFVVLFLGYRLDHSADRIGRNIRIGNADVAGLDRPKAQAKLQAAVEQQRGRTIELRIASESVHLSAQELGLQ
ncbi:MAG: hypothetical protein AAGA56_24990, partial [Myxococcota bacterium]